MHLLCVGLVACLSSPRLSGVLSLLRRFSRGDWHTRSLVRSSGPAQRSLGRLVERTFPRARRRGSMRASSRSRSSKSDTLSTAQRQALLTSGALNKAVVARVFCAEPPPPIVEVTDLNQAYQIHSPPLAQGQMSTVFSATRLASGERLTLKVLKLGALAKSERALLKATGEISALRLVPPHPHLVRIFELTCSPTQCALALDASDKDLLSLLEVSALSQATPSCRAPPPPRA